jgi:hypothetical protein
MSGRTRVDADMVDAGMVDCAEDIADVREILV